MRSADGAIKLTVNGKEVRKFVANICCRQARESRSPYSARPAILEIAVNRGNAARTLGVNRGAEVTLDLT